MSQTLRDATDAELQFLKATLSRLPDKKTRYKKALENCFVMTAATLLSLSLFWLLIAWLSKTLFGLNVGFKSAYGILIIFVLLLVSLVIAIRSTLKWMSSWPDPRPELEEDIQIHKVIEEDLTIVDAKRFEEPEYGGLIYFLKVQGKTRSYVVYDSESQDLGVQNKNPFDSSFRIKRQLKLVTAPTSEWVIEQQFSGMEIPVNETTEIWVHPDKWAEPDSWCDVPWNELEQYFYGENYSRDMTVKNN